MVDRAGLPPEIRLSWDRSLENHQVNISVNIKRAEDVERVLEFLGNNRLKECIEDVLREL